MIRPRSQKELIFQIIYMKEISNFQVIKINTCRNFQIKIYDLKIIFLNITNY